MVFFHSQNHCGCWNYKHGELQSIVSWFHCFHLNLTIWEALGQRMFSFFFGGLKNVRLASDIGEMSDLRENF